jgi:CheY-like chemotaxis protein
MARILVIDDDPEVLAFRQILLASAGHEVRTLENAENLIPEARTFGAELVITDIIMPGLTGGGVCEALRREFGPDLPIIVSSAWRMRIRSPKERDHLLVNFPKTENPEKILEVIQTLLQRAAAPASHPRESEIPAPKPEIPAPRQETPSPKPETRGPKPETPGPKPETPGPRPETPGPKPETPGPKPETPGPKPEIPTPKPPSRNPLFEVPSPNSKVQDPKS